MASQITLRWDYRFTVIIVHSLMFVWTAKALSTLSIKGWNGLSFDHRSRFTGAQPWVNLDHMNARRCVRLCWLFRGCTALTFIPSLQRCQLHRLDKTKDNQYKTEINQGSLTVDMRRVTMASQKVSTYLCPHRELMDLMSIDSPLQPTNVQESIRREYTVMALYTDKYYLY